MIIRETPDSFWMVQQPDHAHLSGLIAEAWHDPYFELSPHREDTIRAVYSHDDSWLPADQTPFWNDVQRMPFSFIHYPSALKIVLYTNGINILEQEIPYSALLVSLHYSSFMNKQVEAESRFLRQEEARQHRLKQHLEIRTEEQQALLHYHFDLLQFCDNLSLYLCLNKPGTSKEDEHPFFQEGFKNSDHFAFTGHQKIHAFWPTPDQVRLRPFPFKSAFEMSMKTKKVSKLAIQENGLLPAYSQTDLSIITVTISPE
ncbi:DUF3891 family protein [Nibrella saemangeumensis]|uniref:DUF3891 family protein n=1 Tax=Nibrella saemangeumensis TaxID=1084526 RepID=A0ABP8MM55_9BACT